jgi:hypothetical protein
MNGKTLGLTVLPQHQKYQSLGADDSLELACLKDLHCIAIARWLRVQRPDGR